MKAMMGVTRPVPQQLSSSLVGHTPCFSLMIVLENQVPKLDKVRKLIAPGTESLYSEPCNYSVCSRSLFFYRVLAKSQSPNPTVR